MMYIDLRSDTFTKPSIEMLEAMRQAEVGDDVFEEDITVKKLEHHLAELFGLEAGLFCPSGTMANQIAIKAHTQPGDEVICDYLSHIYQYESGGIAFNSGCNVKLLYGNRGILTSQLIEEAINPDDIHKPPSTLVSLENTSNRGGGCCYSVENLTSISTLCKSKNIALHLDGARLWNAIIATKTNPDIYGNWFDSISVCLSKGLGAPIGSMLLGNKLFITKARRLRKILGGGMRQVGNLAAAGLYAVQHNFSKLETDHLRAKEIATLLQTKPGVKQVLTPETNILVFELDGHLTSTQVVTLLAKHGILCFPFTSSQIRFVFHLDVTEEQFVQLKHILSHINFNNN